QGTGKPASPWQECQPLSPSRKSAFKEPWQHPVGKADTMDGRQIDRTGEGSRRHFLKTAAAAGGAAALSPGDSAGAQPASARPTPVPTVRLGKTGQEVTILGMGTSWVFQHSFVQGALRAGVRYIDTSENYEGGRCEKILGEVLERTGMRKDVYLVTKNG